nr:unnamed protein product [Spirometra erinaceieuropaei]
MSVSQLAAETTGNGVGEDFLHDVEQQDAFATAWSVSTGSLKSAKTQEEEEEEEEEEDEEEEEAVIVGVVECMRTHDMLADVLRRRREPSHDFDTDEKGDAILTSLWETTPEEGVAVIHVLLSVLFG